MTETRFYSVIVPKSSLMMISHEITAAQTDTDMVPLPVSTARQNGGVLSVGQDNFQIEEYFRQSIFKLVAKGHKVIFSRIRNKFYDGIGEWVADVTIKTALVERRPNY